MHWQYPYSNKPGQLPFSPNQLPTTIYKLQSPISIFYIGAGAIMQQRYI